DVLQCIHHREPIQKAGFHLLPNHDRHLKTPKALSHLFQSHPQWIEETVALSEQCTFSLDEIRYHYPNEWIPQGETAESYLYRLIWDGAKKRYPKAIPPSVKSQMEHELNRIAVLQHSDYSLTIWEIV